MDRTAHLEKRIGNSPISVAAALGNARRTSTVHDEAMEKMDKQLNLCFHEMMTDFLNLVVVTPKPKKFMTVFPKIVKISNTSQLVFYYKEILHVVFFLFIRNVK